MTNYYEVNYFKDGKRDKSLVKAITRRDAISLAKARLNGATILKIKETTPPIEVQLNDLKEKYFGKISQIALNLTQL